MNHYNASDIHKLVNHFQSFHAQTLLLLITYEWYFQIARHLNIHQLKLRMIEFMQNVLKRNSLAYYEI